MSSKHFIGFGTLEDWRRAIDPARPVQANCIVDSNGHSKHVGLAYYKQVIIVSQVQNGDVMYCRIPVDSYEAVNGHTPAFEPERHQRRAESAWEIIRAWIANQGLIWQRAIVAVPRGLKMLEGYADCLHYDNARDLWLRVAPVAAPGDLAGGVP